MEYSSEPDEIEAEIEILPLPAIPAHAGVTEDIDGLAFMVAVTATLVLAQVPL
jgi:hypothetical protein